MVNPLTWEWRSPSILSRWYKWKNVPHSLFFHPSNQHLNCIGWFSNHFRHFCLCDQPMVTTTFNGTLYGTTASRTVPLLGVLPMAAVTEGSCHPFFSKEARWMMTARRIHLSPAGTWKVSLRFSEFVDVPVLLKQKMLGRQFWGGFLVCLFFFEKKLQQNKQNWRAGFWKQGWQLRRLDA